mgnify:FL=1
MHGAGKALELGCKSSLTLAPQPRPETAMRIVTYASHLNNKKDSRAELTTNQGEKLAYLIRMRWVAGPFSRQALGLNGRLHAARS